MNELVKSALKGDRRAIGKLISLVESDGEKSALVMREIHKHAKGAPVVGVTGVAGSGKSTLISNLVGEFRKKGRTVGVIAIDPTSPFSGGAFLGDRVRMANVAMDEGVFIRSMGTRGTRGGLALAVCDTIEILDACGFDLIIVETVGIGQDEVDIIKIADTTVVVVVPGLGDSIQTIKAGIMEIGDILVINKSDLNGADQTAMELKFMQELGGERGETPAPILRTIAFKGEGVEPVAAEIEKHQKHLDEKIGRDAMYRKRCEYVLAEYVKDKLIRKLYSEFDSGKRADKLVDKIVKRDIDPREAAEEVLKGIVNKNSKLQMPNSK